MVQKFWLRSLFLWMPKCLQGRVMLCFFTKCLGMVGLFSLVLNPSPAGANSAHMGIQIEKAWVRAVPPNSKATAVYMVLKNPTAQEEKLLAASSPIAHVGELHEVVKKGKMMMMQPLPMLPVPAQSEVRLQPGGFHIMLIGLKKVPKMGERIRLMLEFQNGKKLEVWVPVQETQEP